MAVTTRHVVTAVMIVVRVPGAQGGETYLRRGRFLPSSVDEAETQRLVDLGLVGIVPVDDEATVPAVPDGIPTARWKVEQIDAWAAAHAIDLSDAATKDDKLALLAEHHD